MIPQLNPDPYQSCVPCLPVCASPFDRIIVSRLIRGGTTLRWELVPTFTDPAPLTFQLQVGTTANNQADDWEDVGLPVTDVYFAIDGEQRVFGNVNWTHYRIKLTTNLGVYYSDPVGVNGILGPYDWRIARELTRQQRLGLRRGGQISYLLKRRVTGIPCKHCLDPQTREVRNPMCPFCYGIGFECGYYFPVSCVFAQIDPKSYRVALDDGQSRATVNDVVVKSRMLNIDIFEEDDVVVVKRTDDRYYVHRVQHLAEWKGVPIVSSVELRPIPFSSIIYDITIPDQITALGEF